MTYRLSKIRDEKVKSTFTLYSEDTGMTMEHTSYIETSKFELVKSIKELWKIIDKNQLLPNDETNPERTPERTRDPNASVIRCIFLRCQQIVRHSPRN